MLHDFFVHFLISKIKLKEYKVVKKVMKKRVFVVVFIALVISLTTVLLTVSRKDGLKDDLTTLTPVSSRPLILDRALSASDKYRKYGDAEGTPRCYKCENEMVKDPEGSLMMNGVQMMTYPVSIFIYPGKWSCSCGYGK